MTDQVALDSQKTLIKSLAVLLGKTSGQTELFETHISWVLVSGSVAYKFKKAVRFDFLDFSALDSRRFYCEEELRLNRRLAPDIYLNVVRITGSHEYPVFDGAGVAIEYAIRMQAFEQQALWSYRLQKGLLSAAESDGLAQKIAQFHQTTAVASADSEWGAAEAVQAIADDNLAELAERVEDADEKRWLEELRSWQATQRQRLGDTFNHRKSRGFIRECHGDLHGGNILTINDQVQVFDCIEFSESLRWIDVMNDIAFVCMDLQFHRRHDLAAGFLNRYLEITGDYEGLSVLGYYQVHRALVRGKVALLRAQQSGLEPQDSDSCKRQAKEYLALARKGIQPAKPALMITHGFSGCGKSTFSGYVVKLLGAVQLRSDVERKRLHGVATTRRDAPALYSRSSTESTYSRLATLATHVVESGRPVIVDAAFLKMEQRSRFARLAKELEVPFFIFDLHASEATMKGRVALRRQLGQDPSDAGLEVLTHQLANHDPLSNDETRRAISVDMDSGADPEVVRKACEPLLRASPGNSME